MELGLIFTYGVCALGVLAGWYNPFIGLLAYYIIAVLRPKDLWFWSMATDDTRFAMYIAVSTIVGWAISGLGKASGLRRAWVPMGGLLLFGLSGLILTYTVAASRERAMHWFDPVMKTIFMAVVTLTLVRDPARIKTLAWVVFLALAYLAVVFNEQYLSGWNRILTHGFGGVDNNGVALIMVIGVPLGFFLAVVDPRWWVKALCVVSMGALIHVVLFSFSRGGMLGLAMSAFLVFVFAMAKLPRKGLTLGIFFLGALGTLFMAGEDVRREFASIFVKAEDLDASAASRFTLWTAAARCIADHPFGIGPRHMNLVIHHYGATEGKSVHNLFLQVGADYGLQGMVGLLIFYLGGMWETIRMSQTAVARRLVWPMMFSYMCVTSVAGFLMSSVFIGIESVEAPYIINLIGLCTACYVDRLTRMEAGVDPMSLPELEQVPPPGFEAPPMPGLAVARA